MVSAPQPPSDQAAAISEVASAQLAGAEPSPFSTAAFDVLKAKVADYIRDLIAESMKMAKRHDADTISPTYVEDANRLLVSNSGKRWYRHLGTVGGILLGAALSNLLSMTTVEKYSTAAILVTAGLGIAGAFMIALHVAKD